MLLLFLISLLVLFSLHDSVLATFPSRGNNSNDADDEFAECNGCFCIPDASPAGSCPLESKPETNFDDIIPTLRSLKWKNPVSLTCDPYQNEDSSCPPPSTEQTGVCVVEIEAPSDESILSSFECPDYYTYSLKTYPETLQEAQDNNRYVTHDSPCGYCSSLQDLSVYMELGPQLRNSAQQCGIRGTIFGQAIGTRCFRRLGFTDACAEVWYYNTRNTRGACFGTCIVFFLLNLEPNLESTCELADCIACDEINSGPVFDVYAGRTRRNSGLLSNIVRPCFENTVLAQPDPCETLERQ